ncbi:hypothetical protein CMV30_18615 [Nibricoccus aquaticus]|uniref:Glycolate oxidase iron-sulfur subunit n=2 Tax=Nibricoccus aquaticus TaxID=2576891 RepID=A0A290QIS3_9BACT|nr:hypothetical protein CMV30_18615 [Nibricoccus aquaticus]
MHCGMCLPTCPTYAETGRERNSPRGRIALMRAVADRELNVTTSFAEEMSYCLGCLACTTACPAGVDYTTLLETARAHVESSGITATPKRTFVRWFTMGWLFKKPRLLRLAGRLLWLYQVTGFQRAFRKLRLTSLLPKRIRELEPSTPKIQRHFSDTLIPEITLARGEKRYRVALLTGCVQDLVFSDVNHATAQVLAENGCEVVTPRTQFCCGSLHAHNGDQENAHILARRQIDTIDPERFDAIISNAAGCGSHLKHYDRLLAEDPRYAARAKAWSLKVRDVSEWLIEIGFRKPHAGTGATAPHIVTYHEACHLCHGQKISKQPREILRAISNVELRECAESTWCCGSAGIYNITQPSTSAWLQMRKLGHLKATGATLVTTANPGCHLQIENGLRATGDTQIEVVHPVVLLAKAYRTEIARR